MSVVRSNARAKATVFEGNPRLRLRPLLLLPLSLPSLAKEAEEVAFAEPGSPPSTTVRSSEPKLCTLK